ncbi:flagellar protein FlaG [Desulfocurvus sp. DL9XJH121]
MELQGVQPPVQTVGKGGPTRDRTHAAYQADNPGPQARQDIAEGRGRTDEAQGLLAITGAVEKMMQSVGVDISFSVDDETRQVQAEVRSEDGKRVIRKVPSDEILRLASSIRSMTDKADSFVERTL